MRVNHASAASATSSAVSIPFEPRFTHSLKPASKWYAEWRSAKVLMDAVHHPRSRSGAIHPSAAARVRNPRARPSGKGSVATPPWLTTPVRIPNRPLDSAVRDGRHGVSDAWTLAKRSPRPARASMTGLVGRR